MKPITKTILTSSIVITSTVATANDSKPSLILADDYNVDAESKDYLTQYWLSEKLDGVRAYWTGTELVTRNGNVIHAPDWFTQSLPSDALDGELWAGRGRFNHVQQTVLDAVPNDEMWRDIRLMVFDSPTALGDFGQRYQALKLQIAKISSNHVELVEHFPVEGEDHLNKELNRMNSLGAEGLMLRRFDAVYIPGRSGDLLKVKVSQDAEAEVVGYTDGKGKYEGLVGSLIVRNEAGLQFKLGSGLSDAERLNPPSIGSVVTYRFNGKTHTGKPRFARFVRVRLPE